MSEQLRDLRILMFPRTMAMGGTEKVVLQLCRALRGKVAYLAVVSCGGELVSELDALGVPHFGIPDITGKNPATFVKIVGKLRRIIRENGINFIHCHHRMAALFAQLAAPEATHVVATAHNVFKDRCRGTRISYSNMHVAACGRKVYENLVDYFRLSDELVTLIPNSVPCFDGNTMPISGIDSCPKDMLKVGFIGRLTEAKGVAFLIDAMALLVERGVPVRCFIAGEGDLEEELRKRTRLSAAARDIVFLGRLDNPQNYLAQVDVCAIPSLWEGLPLVLLEAFSVGTPVVASATDGLTDVIRDGENGFLVPPGNALALANGIERLDANIELRGTIAKAARADYESEYSYEIWVKRYIDFYREALR